MLPDLNKAVQEQAGKRIECQVKPQTVYFNEEFEFEKLSVDNLLSESNFNESDVSYKETEIKYVDDNYEVSTLSVDNLLAESKFQDENKSYKISEIQIADDSYENETLNVDGLLPKMEDVMKNPSQYTSSKQVTNSVNEEDLLNRLANVTFKPFADEEQSYADFNAETLEETLLNENIKEEKTKPVEQFKIEVEPAVTTQPIQNKIQQIKIEQKTASQKTSEILIKKMEEAKKTREENKTIVSQEKQSMPKQRASVNKNVPYSKCILNGISFSIIATSKFGENIGCHLAKSKENYAILGYIGEEITILKEYESVSNERLMARLHETLPNGCKRYLVKIGVNKIVVDVKDDKMNYFMDLC